MAELKAGDAVYLVPHSYGDPWERATICEVEKVHKTGNVVVGGYKYKANGVRSGNGGYTNSRLFSINGENSIKYNKAKLRVERVKMLAVKLKRFDALPNDEKLELLTKAGM